MHCSRACFELALVVLCRVFFFFQAEDGIRDLTVTGVQTCALPIFFVCSLVEVRGLLQEADADAHSDEGADEDEEPEITTREQLRRRLDAARRRRARAARPPVTPPASDEEDEPLA